MVCIYCNSKTKVTNSRSSLKTRKTWRRHKCSSNSCQAIFTSYESPDYKDCFRIKFDNSTLEVFKEDKLFVSIMNSLSHQKDHIEASRHLTDTVLSKVLSSKSQNHQHGIIDVGLLKSIVLETIANYDQPAATYYKAHYIS